jgi:hypothetical protein
MTTVVAPALGHAPLFTQAGTGASPGYDGIDLRRAAVVGLQEGVMAATSYEVTQRAAGTNMSVDIAATGIDAASGIAAVVQGDAVTGQGLYPVPAHTAVINETVTAAHASLPRVDAVILEVQDTTHDASGSNNVRTRVVAGTATAGATLDNARDGSHGGAAIPSNALHLADVLVGAGVTTLANGVIRDRRKWARGAFTFITRTSGYTTSSSTAAAIDATNLNPRVECSGAPVRLTLQGEVEQSDVAGVVSFGFAIDGTNTVYAQWEAPAAGEALPFTIQAVITPSAGSRRFAPYWSAVMAVGTATINTRPLIFTVEEIARQNTPNNATTTG